MDQDMDAVPPEEEDEGLLDKLRDMDVGVTDPHIIGDAGPTDVPPGTDPPKTPREGPEES